MSLPRFSRAFAPDALPPEIRDGSAWYGSDLVRHLDWIEHLSEVEIQDVENAVNELEHAPRDLAAITAENVKLPTLGPRLQDLLNEVLNGRGFVLIKGLPIKRWTKRESAIAFLISVFTSAICGCRMLKDTCWVTLETLDVQAMIQIHESIKRANGKLITPTHVMSLVCCV